MILYEIIPAKYNISEIEIISFYLKAEGSYCRTEDGEKGVCRKIYECPSRLQEVKEGKRNSDSKGRCGFQDFTEIVCCQFNITDKIGLRPAEIGMISF